MIRKFLFGLLVYYFDDMVWCLSQVIANMMISYFFILYLVLFRPFLDQTTFRINVANEFCMYCVSLTYICFTDFNTNAYAKVMTGWLVIFFVIVNLIAPNGYVMVSGIWPDIMKVCCGKKEEIKKSKHQRIPALNVARYKLVNNKRNKRRFRLKKEHIEQDEFDFEKPCPKKNQVTPI